MRTVLASEQRRTCSTYGHKERPATHVRKVQGTKPRTYTAWYPVCAECATAPRKPTPGATEQVTRL